MATYACCAKTLTQRTSYPDLRCATTCWLKATAAWTPTITNSTNNSTISRIWWNSWASNKHCRASQTIRNSPTVSSRMTVKSNLRSSARIKRERISETSWPESIITILFTYVQVSKLMKLEKFNYPIIKCILLDK